MQTPSLLDPVRELFGESPLEALLRQGSRRATTPAMDILETPQEVVIRVDVPGLGGEQIALEVEGDRLTIGGEYPDSEGGRPLLRERGDGPFWRRVQLPLGARTEEASASVSDGVLEVRVPKAYEVSPRRIEVTSGEPDGAG